MDLLVGDAIRFAFGVVRIAPSWAVLGGSVFQGWWGSVDDGRVDPVGASASGGRRRFV